MIAILIAEDDQGVQRELSLLLTDSGYRVKTVNNAQQGIAALEESHFDLVITDIYMPGGDGMDLISHIQRHDLATKIIAISGVTRNNCIGGERDWHIVEDLELLGIHCALQKPFKADALLDEIYRLSVASR